MTQFHRVIRERDEWDAIERVLRSRGLVLHAQACAARAFGEVDGATGKLILVGSDDARTAFAACGARLFQSRSMPGYRILRVERVGSGWPTEALVRLPAALTAAVTELPRILRVHLELHVPSPDAHGDVAAACHGGGWQTSARRHWGRTLVVDLAPDCDQILQSFSQKPRRDLRKLEQLPLELAPIADARWIPRLTSLLDQAYGKRQGRSAPADWAARLRSATEAPQLSRLVGLWRTDRTGDESLIAFAWSEHQGDHAAYDVGATAPQPDLKLSLLTPLLWDLMQWAKEHGASWFDMGGVTTGVHGSADPLGGISDFKRLFSTDERMLGGAWTYEPSPIAASVAGFVRSVLAR